jgi:sugar transferase EpsL
MYRAFGKRLLDLTVATLALLLLAPLLALVALLVRFRMGSPVLFRHQRPGFQGQPFIALKFRTMTNACDAQGNLLPDAERLTAFGQFLRNTSIDELPGLFNILRGEMSLIGPRPLEMIYLDRYSPEQMRRHDVMPGLSGWAQVNGRNLISWERKFELDVWYVDHLSLWLDLKIIVLTFKVLFTQEGISQPGYATTDDFLDARPR